ncbi:hypothetical protein GCM10017567_71100 [Amycolatopsis bullii]|uniref:Secreted protein n=1 Tax=Amycolatopsis bullii TaxID=941987 RepID=A0ABQ3KNV8_9PSEU|nr:hypothetical protein GCM10017567_71100 [Amycolatopsis bullii]
MAPRWACWRVGCVAGLGVLAAPVCCRAGRAVALGGPGGRAAEPGVLAGRVCRAGAAAARRCFPGAPAATLAGNAGHGPRASETLAPLVHSGLPCVAVDAA